MNELNRCKPLLGTYVEVSLRAELSDFELIALSNRVFDQISSIQTQMSFHDPQSTLSQINSLATQTPMTLGEDCIELFAIVSKLNELSAGYFDPCIAQSLVHAEVLPNTNAVLDFELDSQTLGVWKDLEFTDDQLIKHKPLMIDLGGIAKGFAVDKAIEVIPEGVKASVNAGGDLRFTHWQDQCVGIKHGQIDADVDSMSTSAITMLAPALATTSSYYSDGLSHVVNPKDGLLQDDVCTYSVFAPYCVLADGLTKLACLLHASQPAMLEQILNYYNATLIVLD